MRTLCIGGPNDGEWHDWINDRPTINIMSRPPLKTYFSMAEELFHNPADHYDRYTTYERHEIKVYREPSLWVAVPSPSNHTLYDSIRALMLGYRQPR